MSRKMSGSYDSDPEPVSRLKDVGRQKPPKRPATRHIVNPNFMFFCQIVLLVIPITVLYAGLYFMNISSPLIVLICGAIIFVVLCIFMFVRPFKEEKCEEKKPLRRSYDYSPIKLTTDADPVKTERASPQKSKPDKCLSLRREEDNGDEEEDDEECPSRIKSASTDTLLSIGNSDLSLIATQTRTAEAPMAGIVASADGQCRCCQMGCRGPIPRESEEVLLQKNLRQSKQSLPMTVQDCDGCTWETKGYTMEADQISPPCSLRVIEEEGDSTRPESLVSPSPCSEKTYYTEKLLMPDVALSDTTNPSIPTTNHTITNLPNTPYSDITRQPDQSQSSDRRTMPGYTTQESSAVAKERGTKSPPQSPRKTKSPQRFEQQTFAETPCYDSGQSNIESFRNARRLPTDVTCPNKISPFEFRHHKDKFISHPRAPKSPNAKSPNVTQKIPQNDINYTKNEPHKDIIIQTEAACTTKLCPFVVENQLETQVDSRMPSVPNNAVRNGPLTKTPEKPIKSKKKRGYLEEAQNEEEKLAARGKQNIFLGDSHHSRKSIKEQELQAVTFQLCPSDKATRKDQCSSTDHNRTKQPILIKLFPTSSKDGVFSWEANPVRHNGIENTPANNAHPAFPDRPQQSRTADEWVQTTAPEMVDTQTSAVFPAREQKVRYNVPEVKDSSAKQGKPAHQTTSGSVVDFVLRPFAKVVKPLAKTTGDRKSKKDKVKSCKTSNQSGDKQRPQEIAETNNDSSKFDLLKIRSSSKKENGRASENRREGENKPISLNNEKKFPRKEMNAKLDICSIYYSSIKGKLYQPTRSGLLVTESSKEEVDNRQEADDWPKIQNAEADKALYKSKNTETSPRHHKRGRYNLEPNQKQPGTAERLRTETRRILTRTKRKSDDERKSKSKCARHDRSEGRKPKQFFGDETSLPWQKETIENTQMYADSELKDKITFMFPPFNLDFSSGPCDEDSKISSGNQKSKPEPGKSACKKLPIDCRVSRKPQSPGAHHGSKSKNQRISHQVETTLFRKSSSSYENVVIEKVIKQKKRTLKKYK